MEFNNNNFLWNINLKEYGKVCSIATLKLIYIYTAHIVFSVVLYGAKVLKRKLFTRFTSLAG